MRLRRTVSSLLVEPIGPLALVCLSLLLPLSSQTSPHQPETSLKDSLTTPVTAEEGDDALLTCVVRNQRNYTIMWKQQQSHKAGARILTANRERVTSDTRFSVLHENGGQVYVLLLRATVASDAGMYLCEVNSNPPIRSFHQLRIAPKLPAATLVAPPPPRPSENRTPATAVTSSALPTPAGPTKPPSSQGTAKDALSLWGYSTARPILHDYTTCCAQANVTTKCQAFCNLKAILDGETGGTSPTECEADFPRIVTCMADGRDHEPCCREAGVPDACRDLCRGEYTVQTDLLKSHFSCAAHTAPTLACIAAGIDLLPGPPREMSATALNASAIEVKWMPPSTDPTLTKDFVVNVTYHQLLSPVFSVTVNYTMAKKFYPPFSTLHRIPANSTHTTIPNLERFSLYEVRMWTEGVNAGRSLPTYREMVVTHVAGGVAAGPPKHLPRLPDVKACCLSKNVTHTSCVEKFCDPTSVSDVRVPDMMICAPWDTEIFSCLADGQDHTPCCKSKRLPLICQDLCGGKAIDLNFRYFRCLSYMKELSSCLLEGYGVLPSAPVNFRFSNVVTNFGILHWEKPDEHGDSVKSYLVNYQEIGQSVGQKKTIANAQSPFILENLNSSTTYEVYIEAVNEHGVGEESSRIVFRTASRTISDLKDDAVSYNQTECCLNSGVRSECQPLCSYNAKMSDVEKYGLLCVHDFSKIVRCAVAGRDHLPCCTRRGVPKACQPLCQAVHQTSTGAEFSKCLPHIGQVLVCLEEGSVQLPPPVRALRAIYVNDSQVGLVWRTGSGDLNSPEDASNNVTHFEVYYKRLDVNSSVGTVFSSDNQINTTDSRAVVSGLETGGLYRFFVVSRNAQGTSLPSSILRVNVSAAAWGLLPKGVVLRGSTSPPHLVEVEAHSATWLQVTWNPPAITHPEDVLRYRVFYRQVSDNSSNFSSVYTEITTVKLTNLTPNSQYLIYAIAISATGIGASNTATAVNRVESEPSEELVAWTDPAFPAFVEAPTVHPINMVTEGSDMTVLCIAMGTPMPTVTLYVDGHPIRSDVTRHMVTVIHNVTRDMGHISCYADNGYGTPMQASRQITISRKPTVRAPIQTHVMVDDEVTLRCQVDAFPAPTIAVYRDRRLRESVRDSERVRLTASGTADDAASFSLTMTISRVTEDDGGAYYCHANNTQGESVALMGVNVTSVPPPVTDVTACCRAQNVSASCLDICTFSLDFDTLLRKPHCISEFNQLMHCASDGSDHRYCCSRKGVPPHCINWCRGQPADESDVCAVSHAKQIVGCFHEGNQHLPSPPRNIIVRLGADRTAATVHWDAPDKNPDRVELYRVYWRPIGAKETLSNDTTDTQMRLSALTGGTTYELVVKAGNANGTSHLTAPLMFATGDEVIITTSTRTSSGAGAVVGTVIAVIMVAVVLLLAVYVMKKRKIVLSVKKANSPTVAFENPFYTSRESQVNNQTGNSVSTEGVSSSDSWQGEMVVRGAVSETDSATTSDSTHSTPGGRLTAMKFGRAGQGFQRFK